MTTLDVLYVNSNNTADPNFNVLLMDALAGSFTQTLPLITADGIYLILKRVDSNIATSITIAPASQNTVKGLSLDVTIGRNVSLISYGDSWYALT